MTLPASVLDRFASALIEDLPPSDWARLRDRIAASVDAIRRVDETRDPTIHTSSSVPVVLALAIKKLGSPAVGDALQAYLWTLSAEPIHRAWAEAWMFAHPDETAAFERDTDEHLAVAPEGRSIQDEAFRFVPERPPRTIRFAAVRDEAAAVWSATSEEHISTEAATREELLERLKAIVPDVLESREGRTGPLVLIVDWQVVRTVDQSTLAIA